MKKLLLVLLIVPTLSFAESIFETRNTEDIKKEIIKEFNEYAKDEDVRAISMKLHYSTVTKSYKGTILLSDGYEVSPVAIDVWDSGSGDNLVWRLKGSILNAR